MRLYIIQSNGALAAAKYEDEIIKFDTSTLSPFNTFDIDEGSKEEPLNKDICLAFVNAVNKTNDEGLPKYYFLNGEAIPRAGWVEKVREIL